MRYKWKISILILFVMKIKIIQMSPIVIEEPRSSFNIGACTWVIDKSCPDEDIKFYLYTRLNPDDRQMVHIDESWESSNLSMSNFNPQHSVKIIIHGYNSDMFLTPLIDMKKEYLQRGSYNLFYVDWAILAPGPCYPSAVHNTKHVGYCIAQLVERLNEAGSSDVHLIGFSLGAQVTNYASNKLKPDITLPRITGLDPAMPGFAFAALEDKLDPSDANFVDVIHTNALVQGKLEQCGHVDFYFNGGIFQPGCASNRNNPFACSHHRAPDYFSESIQSILGFWGWNCHSYIYYLLGMCKPTKTSFQAVAGEDCKTSSRGMFMIPTSANYPYAIGRLSDIITPASETSPPMSSNLIRSSDPFQKSIDSWGKLESNFNNMENYKDFLEEDVFEDDWNVYSVRSNKITHDFIIKLRQQHEDELNLLRKITNRQKVLKVHPSKRKLTSQKNKNRPTNMTSRKQLFHEKLENN